MRSPVTERRVLRPVVQVQQHCQVSDGVGVTRTLARRSVCLRNLLSGFEGKTSDTDLRNLWGSKLINRIIREKGAALIRHRPVDVVRGQENGRQRNQCESAKNTRTHTFEHSRTTPSIAGQGPGAFL